jgi:hypothetical protein
MTALHPLIGGLKSLPDLGFTPSRNDDNSVSSACPGAAMKFLMVSMA